MTKTMTNDNAATAARILAEGYGPGAWHGADMKAAIADVEDAAAFRRPAAGRHNIAEIAVHHAFYQHSVRQRLLGTDIEAFPFAGEDWFTLDDASQMSWPEIKALVADLQSQLEAAVKDTAAGKMKSPKTETEQMDLWLGITGHAIYHAGQIQLIKVLLA